VTAIVGLSNTYTVKNLFENFASENRLIGNEEERKALLMYPMGATGMRTSQSCIAWALDVVKVANDKGELVVPQGSALTDTIVQLRTSLASLYHYQFQVIPYVYLHVLSFVNAVYLIAYAAHAGLGFHPGASYTDGLLFPLINSFIFVVTTLGLLTVGESLANPFGAGIEDFAVATFLKSCASNSRQLIEETAPGGAGSMTRPGSGGKTPVMPFGGRRATTFGHSPLSTARPAGPPRACSESHLDR